MHGSVLSRYLDEATLAEIDSLQFKPLDLVVGNLAGGHKSPLAGFAVEFAGHREYVPGDDPRHVDWRIYFNRGKYFVKQYELETNLTCHFLLDDSRSMCYGLGDQQKLLYAARSIAALAYAVLRRSDKVALATFDRGLRSSVPPSNSEAQLTLFADCFERASMSETTAVGASMSEFASRAAVREMVVVVSDFLCELGPIEAALQQLRFQQHQVLLMHVMHRDEVDFPLHGPRQFVGMEPAKAIRANSDDLRQAYQEVMQEFCEELQDLTSRNRCEYLRVVTDRSLSSQLATYLK